MKTRPPTPLTPAQREALEARFALRLSARLEEGAQSVSHDVSERLRVAREQAIRAAREARLAAASPVVTVTTAPAVTVAVAGLAGVSGHTGANMGGLGNWSASKRNRAGGSRRGLGDDTPPTWGWRLASMLPVLALVTGLWGIHRYYKQEQVQAATDVDMALLTDDLPPAAYADPGFAEFLRSDTGPTVRPIESAESAAPEPDGDLRTTETAPASVTP